MEYGENFGTSNDYSELNNGLHRRSTMQLKPPLLSWHLSFWRRDLTDRDPNFSLAKRESDSLDQIDSFIIAFYKNVLQLNSDFEKTGVGKPFFHSARANKAILLNSIFDMPNMDNPQHRRDLYDIDGLPLPSNILFPIQKDVFESSYRDITIDFDWNSSKVCVRIEPHTEFVTISFFVGLDKDSAVISFSDTLESETTKTAEKLYSDFWTEFWDFFLAGDELKGLMDDGKHRHPVFRHVFGEFRGAILQMSNEQQTSARSDWGHATIKNMLPLITNSAIPTECCANYFFEDRVLYMSTLGYENFDTENEERVPVHYIMMVPSDMDEWQLGRLVVRLNFLGTLRLAAIRSLRGVLRAGRVLTELEPLVKSARDKVSKGGHTEMATAMKAANSKFDEIHRLDPEILFRIERSRYYIQQFTENVDALRIGRLEGYQQYDDFVRRRLGATVDFIDRLGKRYDRAATNLALLQQYAFSSTANNISKGGEAALFLFLIPYYATSFMREIGGNDGIIFYLFLSIICTMIGGWTYVQIKLPSWPTIIRLFLATIAPLYLVGGTLMFNNFARKADHCNPPLFMKINMLLSEAPVDPDKLNCPSQHSTLTSPPPAAGSPPRPGG